MRLVEMSTLYAGVLAFDEEHIETVFRGWLDWTQTAHPQVTTSTAILNLPDLEFVPLNIHRRCRSMSKSSRVELNLISHTTSLFQG